MDEQITGAPEATSEWYRSPYEETLTGVETILLVEDEAFVRDVTCEVLQFAGYRVLTATNAAEALGIHDACRGDVELLLTDVILRGETGRALAGRLRRENPGLKVLLVSGYAEQLGLLEAVQEEYLAKPFSTEGLLRRVRQVLDRRMLPIGAEKRSSPSAVSGSLQDL